MIVIRALLHRLRPSLCKRVEMLSRDRQINYTCRTCGATSKEYW